MAQTMNLMVSFSQPERFTWHDDAFTVMIPNGNRTAYHPRVSQSNLRALLMPQLRLTRGGNISQHQPDPPAPQPYDFYLAQLIHYGLDFHFGLETAQRALEIEIRLGRLRVPPSLRKLERELERAYKRAQKKAHEDAMKLVVKQEPGDDADAAVSIESSEEESEDESVLRPAPPKSAKKEKEKNKQKIIESSTESEESSEEESSSDNEGDSDKESDTIMFAPARHDSTSSSSLASSSSSEDVQKVKRPSLIPPAYSKIDNESSETSDDDPFLDRQDVKRIKLENADENKDSVFRSTRAIAPLILRKQPPPSQAKVRRIASNPQSPMQSMSTAVRQALDSHSASVRPASGNTNANRKPFVSPDKRPSWTIPVRSSPSSAQKDSPKSVTFSQVQHETPPKVPKREETGFSSTLKTHQGTPHHRKTASTSSDQGQFTPLRSILKKTTANPNTNPTLPASNIARAQISVHVPHNADTNTSARQRRRRRKSGTEERPAQVLELDGARDVPDASKSSHTDKPFIVSDIVNGKPMSSQQNGGSVKSSHTFSPRYPDDVMPARRSTGGGNGGFTAINSDTYQQQQQAKKAKNSPHMHMADFGTTPGSAPKTRLSLNKGDASVTPKLDKKLGLGKGQHSGMGSGSRGSLVRAGRVY